MDNQTVLKEWLTDTVRLLVDSPDDVRVDALATETGILLRITAASGDVGKIIGKNARNAQSLRVLAHAIAMKLKTSVSIDIVDRPR